LLMQGMSSMPPNPISLTICFLNSLSFETMAKTAFGVQRLVMFAAEDALLSLEFGEDGVTDPPPRVLPEGAEEDGPTGRLGFVPNSGTHFSSRWITMFVRPN